MQTPDPPRVNIQAHLRFMKQVFYIMVFSVGMYLLVLLRIGHSVKHLPLGMKMGIEICALVSALVVLFVRFLKIAGVLVPDVPIPPTERLAKIRAYSIVCYVFAETVALYGFLLGYMGGSLIDAAPFFAGSLLLYALCYPRLPSDLDGGQP